LWHQNPSHIVVPCGGLGLHAPAEADVMRDLLIESDVPPDMIHCEDQSTSTYENLRNAARILRRHDIRNITIVTNVYHGPRSKLVARAVGLRPIISAPDITGAHMPSHYRMVLREIPALPAYALRLIWWRFRDRKF
jgi:uncharacterized SAM-binding protein YcdF (DUF218 family)